MKSRGITGPTLAMGAMLPGCLLMAALFAGCSFGGETGPDANITGGGSTENGMQNGESQENVQFEAEVNVKMREIRSSIEDMRLLAEDLSGDARQEALQLLDELETRYSELSSELEGLQQQAAENWEQTRQNVFRSLEVLREEFNDAQRKIGEVLQDEEVQAVEGDTGENEEGAQ